jgi:hypothetical protein
MLTSLRHQIKETVYLFLSHREKESQARGKSSCFCKLIHRKKEVRKFPVPSRDVTTKLSLGGNNDVITELFLPRGSLVSDIPAGDGKLVNLFYGVGKQYVCMLLCVLCLL